MIWAVVTWGCQLGGGNEKDCMLTVPPTLGWTTAGASSPLLLATAVTRRSSKERDTNHLGLRNQSRAMLAPPRLSMWIYLHHGALVGLATDIPLPLCTFHISAGAITVGRVFGLGPLGHPIGTGFLWQRDSSIRMLCQ